MNKAKDSCLEYLVSLAKIKPPERNAADWFSDWQEFSDGLQEWLAGASSARNVNMLSYKIVTLLDFLLMSHLALIPH